MSSQFRFGFDVVIEKGVCPRPVSLKAWQEPEAFERCQAPFKYMADVLCGLALLKLNPNLSGPVSKKVNTPFAQKAWASLEPSLEIWKRSQDRVQSLHNESPKWDAKSCAEFEKKFTESLQASFTPNGIDLKNLWSLIDMIGSLESRNKSPLIYNFGLRFSPGFTEQLHALYSFLFNLRSLVAVDWNAHVDDPSHEAVKVDSITDYIPKADYVVSDAMMYWNFLKLSKPFVSGRNSDVKVEKLLLEPMKKSFHASSHHACHLIEHLPQAFLEDLGPSDLEEALYLVQMDWLLGSEAGLLFRVREELFGLQNGYEKIFWHDLQGAPRKKSFNLSIGFVVDEKDFGARAA